MAGALTDVLGEVLVAADGEEVAVSALAARGVSLVGLYFGCSLGGPCAQLGASLAAFYGRFRGEAAAAGGQRLEIVFVSAEQEQQQWQEAVRAMPWLALPFADKHRKLKLWNKYRVSNIPSLIFIDAATGKVVCRNGLLVIRDDPEGLEFPWGPKPFSEVVAGPLLRNNGQTLDSSALEGSHVGVYFSAHWCPPCRSLTRVLVESYRKIKEAGQKFEILFVSADRSEDSFKQYFSEMPWVAVPYADEARRSRLNRLYGIQGIPTLIVLDSKGDVITRQGRVEVLNDIECREFPWHPKPVLELTDSNAVQLNEGPCLVLFVDFLLTLVIYSAEPSGGCEPRAKNPLLTREGPAGHAKPDGLGLALQASGKSYFYLALSKVFLSPCCKQLIRRTAGAPACCFWGWMVLMKSTSDVLGQRCSWCCSKAGTGNGGFWPALSCCETPPSRPVPALHRQQHPQEKAGLASAGAE
ncbi:nucleoredoxin isoform X1 [Corvus cornix cornix]|uniref:nucleoredoxin isoform X1 n=1 Tax=Corvus cornix cornix TaxID=932674 RepID=UPI001950FEF1|nr:nucleoredoxin isoform X1 [Corvus cornix cornix]